MSHNLVMNVWAGGRGYGPSFGDDPVPAEHVANLPLHVWADGVAPEVDDDPSDDQAEAPDGSDPDPEPVDLSDLLDGVGERPAAADPDPNPADTDLDTLDKPALLALAEARGIDIDKRTGVARLRKVLAEHEGP